MSKKKIENVSAKNGMKTEDIVLVGMFSAVLAVISQISIPMPSGVPITIQMFGIALVGVVLGWKKGFCATVVYILIGACGIPVFSNMRGGIQVLAGPTGGYILAWPVMAALSGIQPGLTNEKENLLATAALSLVGLMVVEIFGAWYWSRLALDRSFASIVVYSFVAFIPKDIVLTLIAVVLGKRMRGRVLVRN